MFEVTRCEVGKSRDGKDECFMAMEIVDDLGTYNFGKWLTPGDTAKVIADPTEIDAIAEKYLTTARLNYEASLAAQTE